MDSKWALVTGGSVGIGLDISRELAAKGYELVLVARNEEKLAVAKAELEKEYSVHVHTISKDLSEPDAARYIYDEAQKISDSFEVLVNNAGIGLFGFFHELSLEATRTMMNLNMTVLTELTHLFLPSFLGRKKGYVLNVASTASFQPGPLMAVYYASKAYVLSLSEALANEVASSGVKVTALCPGATESEFFKRADMTDSGLLKLGLMPSRKVAQTGVRALFSGRRVVVPGMKNKIGAFSPRVLPRSWITAIVRNVQKAD